MPIERNTLIQQARERGVFLTRDKLAKWQQAGLIEPAEIVYGQGRGARSYYADDTLERAALIASVLQQWRDMDRVRLMMWRAGYPVSARPVFESAVTFVHGLKREIDLDLTANLNPRSKRVPLYEQPVDPDRLPLARKLHKQFKVRYEALAFLVYQLFEGDVNLSDEGDEMKPLAGLFKLFHLPVNLDTLGQRLNELAEYIQPDSLEEVLSGATDGALLQSDKQWRALLERLEALYNVMRLSLGKRSGELFGFEDQPPDVQALFVLIFHSLLMRADIRENYGKLIDALEPFQSL